MYVYYIKSDILHSLKYLNFLKKFDIYNIYILIKIKQKEYIHIPISSSNSSSKYRR